MPLEIVGYTPLNEFGKPNRPHRSGYSWQTNLTSPPRIYTTEYKAAVQSPVKKAAPVYLEVPDDQT